MTLPLTRDQALELLRKYNPPGSDWNHFLESEAVMRFLARRLNEDEEYWSMLGLLHDIDWGITKNNPQEHLTKAPQILKESGFEEEFISNLISHGHGFDELPQQKNLQRQTKIEHALAAAETITGLIHSYALMRGKKISDMDSSGLLKKFKDKKFAAAIRRDIIEECSYLGLSLGEFFQLAIDAIKSIKDDVGLQ